MTKKIYIIYHAQCHDGAAAAWVAWKKFGDNNVVYIPATYGDEFPEIKEKDAEVYILDFSYSKEVLLKQTVPITILDHHKTAQAELEGLSGVNDIHVIFDMERSGAGIAWDYFFDVRGNEPSNSIITWEIANAKSFISYVEDRDLFLFKYKKSKPLYYVMQGYNYNFRKYDELINDLDNIIIKGELYQEYNENLVKLLSKQIKQYITLDCVMMPVFELSKEFGSDVCKYFLDHNKEYDVCTYFTQKKEKHWEWGIRGNGNIDVSMIAKLYGGGGHKDVAGFPVYGSSPYEFKIK